MIFLLSSWNDFHIRWWAQEDEIWDAIYIQSWEYPFVDDLDMERDLGHEIFLSLPVLSLPSTSLSGIKPGHLQIFSFRETGVWNPGKLLPKYRKDSRKIDLSQPMDAWCTLNVPSHLPFFLETFRSDRRCLSNSYFSIKFPTKVFGCGNMRRLSTRISFSYVVKPGKGGSRKAARTFGARGLSPIYPGFIADLCAVKLFPT